MCSLQPDAGSCEALSFRYFWNITTRQCEIFRYGGCDGNFNRFSDAKSCANQCGKYRADTISISFDCYVVMTMR